MNMRAYDTVLSALFMYNIFHEKKNDLVAKWLWQGTLWKNIMEDTISPQIEHKGKSALTLH